VASGFALLLFLALGAPCALAQASAPPPTAVIGEIHFTGSSHFTDAQVAAEAGLKPGAAVTRQDLQIVANHLAQLGIFDRVDYRYTNVGDKISVQFILDDAPTVPVLFDNFPWFTDQELSAAIRQVVPLFHGTAPRGGAMVEEMTAAIAKLLPTRRVSGTVQHTLLEQPMGDGMLMQFRLEGPTLRVGSLQYGDSIAQDSEALRERSSDLVGKPFSRFAIEIFENEQIRPLYLTGGHIRVRFGTPLARFTGNPDQPLSAQKLLVVLPIDPGPVFRLSGATWTGDAAFPPASLSALLGVKPGDLADGMKLEAGWQHIEQQYAHLGYLDMKLDPQASFDDASATVSYRVAVSEGPQYHMGKLIITGLSLEAQDAFLLRWQLHRGQVFDGAYFDDMLTKIEKPTREIFGNMPIHYQKMGHWLQRNPKTGIVDVLLDFQ
jgi:Surface antigen variable number repeat